MLLLYSTTTSDPTTRLLDAVPLGHIDTLPTGVLAEASVTSPPGPRLWRGLTVGFLVDLSSKDLKDLRDMKDKKPGRASFESFTSLVL
jgi:hypothetical protein